MTDFETYSESLNWPSPRILDLFCCQGGAGTGYRQAGFEVVGVDLQDQPRYPFEFHQADALEYLEAHGHEFDAVHASPPCQAYSTITPAHSRGSHPTLIEPVREALQRLGKPYIIENMEGARKHLIDPVKLCGSTFGLRVRRHRYFEINWPLASPGRCNHKAQGRAVGVYGDGPDRKEYRRPDGSSRGVKATSVEDASDALGGVSWMTWKGMAECIPPVYTKFLGAYLNHYLESEAA